MSAIKSLFQFPDFTSRRCQVRLLRDYCCCVGEFSARGRATMSGFVSQNGVQYAVKCDSISYYANFLISCALEQ